MMKVKNVIILYITCVNIAISQALTSMYIESCLLSAKEVRFELDREQNKFKKIAVDSDYNASHNGSTDVNKNEGNNTSTNTITDSDNNNNSSRSLLRKESTFLLSSSLPSSSQRRPSSLSGSSSSSKQTETIFARECPCGSRRRNTTTYCLITSNDENHCRVPNSKDYPVECFNTSNYKQFITNAWPLSLLWFLALLIYLISTEAGRNTIKYACSKFIGCLCCCCPSSLLGGGETWGNSRLIESIISRETAMRDLFHLTSFTRAVEEQRQRIANSNPVTYVLKTKAYSSPKASDSKNKQRDENGGEGEGDNMKKTLDNQESCIEMTNFQGIDQSSSNETMITTPESLESPTSLSLSFDQYDIDDNGNDCAINEQQEGQKQTTTKASNDDAAMFQCSSCNGNTPNDSFCNIISPPQNHYSNDEYEDEDEVMCTICMIAIEDGDRVGALPCDHLFHVDCLKEWIKRRNVCPLCQTPIAEERNNPNDEEGGSASNVASPTFTVRTTGSPIELAPRRRTRRSRTVTTTTARTIGANGQIQSMNGTRRQLFYASSEGRIPPRLNTSAGVAIITVTPPGASNSSDNRNNRSNRNNRNVRILVGDAASSTPSSAAHRIRNSFL